MIIISIFNDNIEAPNIFKQENEWLVFFKTGCLKEAGEKAAKPSGHVWMDFYVSIDSSCIQREGKYSLLLFIIFIINYKIKGFCKII